MNLSNETPLRPLFSKELSNRCDKSPRKRTEKDRVVVPILSTLSLAGTWKVGWCTVWALSWAKGQLMSSSSSWMELLSSKLLHWVLSCFPPFSLHCSLLPRHFVLTSRRSVKQNANRENNGSQESGAEQKWAWWIPICQEWSGGREIFFFFFFETKKEEKEINDGKAEKRGRGLRGKGGIGGWMQEEKQSSLL